ncbi:MAG: hypothetical protein QF383_07515 [Flavobacteriales bacterium]|nr:hypothetical protein [Flavobacteriales bacterium]
MKKITLMLLVAMVPFLTMAQKRSKKGKEKTEKINNSNASYEFMVITGYEITINKDKRIKGGPDQIPSPDTQLKRMMLSNSRVGIQFDFGGNTSDENTLLSENRYRSMSHAVNGAANNGWEFVSSDVIVSGVVKIHYYYMRKTK